MAQEQLRWSRWVLLVCMISGCNSAPAVAFPFNSQVPTVARVGAPYDFQLSDATFIPYTSNFTYSLSDQPAWLLLDSATRTLSGVPSSADVGASSFTITAADDTGGASMLCVLVVSSDPPPQIAWSISTQLAAEANLSSSQPPVVTVLPATQFRFDFRQESFIDIVARKLTYYATLTDHAPLPAWLTFDRESLSFTGTTPQLSAFPQSWSVDLIASDVKGFAGAAASFTVAIGTQQLVFVPEYQKINITAGMHMDFDRLGDMLYLNGDPVAADTLESASASMPAWMQFDAKTLALSGIVPSDVSNENITITAIDKAGNTAIATIGLQSGTASLFAGTVPTMTATLGDTFSFHFDDSLFTSQDVELMVVLPASAQWLQFDATTRVLSGTVPTRTTSTKLEATLTAKSSEGAVGQSQTFTIDIVAPTTKSSTSSRITVRATPTHHPGLQPTNVIVAAQAQHQLSNGAVAGIISGAVVAATIVALLLVCCWRRSRRDDSYVEATSPQKRIISRPIPPPDAATIAVTTDMHTDVEKLGKNGEYMDNEPPPQIALDLPNERVSRRMKWSKRFSRISHVSSIGNGEDAIMADDNIPVLGSESHTLHAPHDSFSVPTEIARTSRQLSDLSPSKRALRRLHENPQSRNSIGLGINTGNAELLPRHSSRNARYHRKARSSLGHSTLLEGSSVVSFSTRGTSVLSTKPAEFPRPPTRSTMTGSRSIPALALTEAEKRRSIRMVARSNSTLKDNRSMHEKRQSFIRNRASTSLASPLFAHGSAALSESRGNGNSSIAGSVASSRQRSKRGKSQLTTYSESSSVEPPRQDPRRLSARIRSAFAPSFPRAVTRSSLGADDEAGADGEASSEYYSTSSSITDGDLVAEMALPRHQRSWVLPGEASPTPPPAPPTSRQPSRGHTPASAAGRPRQKWKERLRERSASPLATAVAVPIADHSPQTEVIKATTKRRSRLSEPLSLISHDSLNRNKSERPRLVHASSKRPVSVDKVRRLSSLRAETEDTRPGSEMWEAMERGGLMPPAPGEGRRDVTQGSNMSGPAFI